MKKKDLDFTPWDMASGNEICLHCARCTSKDKMCSWFKREEPVPGCIAIHEGEYEGIHSMKILRCPQFLESEDDPDLTEEEYEQQYHGLVVNLFRMSREYRKLFYSVIDSREKARSRLKKAEKELAALEKQLNRLKKQGVAADSFDEIFYADEQQK